MRKIVFAVALFAGMSAQAHAQFQIQFGQDRQNGYDATERMNEQNRQMWDREEANRNRVLQSGGVAGSDCPPAALTCPY